MQAGHAETLVLVVSLQKFTLQLLAFWCQQKGLVA